MTSSHRLCLCAASAVALTLVAAGPIAVSDAASPSARAHAHSRAHVPSLHALKLTPTGRRAVRLAFRVHYPRVGPRAHQHGEVRLVVWRNARRHQRVVTKRFAGPIPSNGLRRYVVRLRGRPAALLRRDGRRLLTAVVYHHRNIDGDRHHDHIMSASWEGHAVPARRRVRARASAALDQLTIRNEPEGMSRETVRLSAAALQCIDDHGRDGGSIDAFNGVVLEHGQSITHALTTTNLPPLFTYAFGSDEAVNRIYNAEIRAYLFEVNDASSTVLSGRGPTFAPAYGPYLPDVFGLCQRATPTFLLGFDTFGTRGFYSALMKVTPERIVRDLVLEADEAFLEGAGGTLAVGRSDRSCAPPALEDWMACSASAKPLSGTVLPGARNAGSAMSDPALVVPSSRDTEPCRAFGGRVGATSSTAVDAFSVTQRLTIRQLLERGIRWIDLPVGDYKVLFPLSESRPPEGRWRTAAGMFSHNPLVHDVGQVINWAVSHPDELVVLDLSRLCAPTSAFDELATVLTRYRDPGSGYPLCDVTVKSASPAALPRLSVEAVRGPLRNVVALVDGRILSDPDAARSLAECGVYPTRAPAPNGPAVDAVPIVRADPTVDGPPDCSADSARRSAEAVAAAPFESGLRDWRARYEADLPLYQTVIGYRVRADRRDVSLSNNFRRGVCPASLLDWNAPLAAFNSNIVEAWGPDTNVVLLDGVTDLAVAEVLGIG